MSSAIQFDLFEEIPSEQDILVSRIDDVEQKQNRHCRSFHAKLADIMKIVLAQSDEIDRLKKIIYKMEQVK
jgi:hypothetical protein